MPFRRSKVRIAYPLLAYGEADTGSFSLSFTHPAQGVLDMPIFENVFLSDTLVLATTLNEDKQFATTIVQNLQVDLPSREKPIPPTEITVGGSLGDSPFVASRSANLFVQLGGEVDACGVTVQIIIRGSVDLMPGSRALLVTRLAGTTFTDELTASGEVTDFQLTHSAKARSKKGVPVTFFLLVDRDIVDGALPYAFAVVVSLEFSFETSAALDCKS